MPPWLDHREPQRIYRAICWYTGASVSKAWQVFGLKMLVGIGKRMSGSCSVVSHARSNMYPPCRPPVACVMTKAPSVTAMRLCQGPNDAAAEQKNPHSPSYHRRRPSSIVHRPTPDSVTIPPSQHSVVIPKTLRRKLLLRNPRAHRLVPSQPTLDLSAQRLELRAGGLQ